MRRNAVMKKFLQEFKIFALKGNVMQLAVGVIIGAAFQGVVSSFTENILSPIIGLFTTDAFSFAAWEIGGIKYGAFFTTVVDFLIMAFVVFLLVRFMNRLLESKPKAEAAAPSAPKRKCPYCTTEVANEATRCPACTSVLEAEN